MLKRYLFLILCLLAVDTTSAANHCLELGLKIGQRCIFTDGVGRVHLDTTGSNKDSNWKIKKGDTVTVVSYVTGKDWVKIKALAVFDNQEKMKEFYQKCDDLDPLSEKKETAAAKDNATKEKEAAAKKKTSNNKAKVEEPPSQGNPKEPTTEVEEDPWLQENWQLLLAFTLLSLAANLAFLAHLLFKSVRRKEAKAKEKTTTKPKAPTPPENEVRTPAPAPQQEPTRLSSVKIEPKLTFELDIKKKTTAAKTLRYATETNTSNNAFDEDFVTRHQAPNSIFIFELEAPTAEKANFYIIPNDSDLHAEIINNDCRNIAAACKFSENYKGKSTIVLGKKGTVKKNGTHWEITVKSLVHFE